MAPGVASIQRSRTPGGDCWLWTVQLGATSCTTAADIELWRGLDVPPPAIGDFAQVLSHLGSGAEVGQAGLEASLGSAGAPRADFNRSVWARWDAISPGDQAAGFLTANESFVASDEAIDDATGAPHRSI